MAEFREGAVPLRNSGKEEELNMTMKNLEDAIHAIIEYSFIPKDAKIVSLHLQGTGMAITAMGERKTYHISTYKSDGSMMVNEEEVYYTN